MAYRSPNQAFDTFVHEVLAAPKAAVARSTPKQALKELKEVAGRYRSGKKLTRTAVRDTLKLAFQIAIRLPRDAKHTSSASLGKLLGALGLEGREQELCDAAIAHELVPLAAIKAITKPKSRSQEQTASERSRAVREVLARGLADAEALQVLQAEPVRQLAAAFAERNRTAEEPVESQPETVAFALFTTPERLQSIKDRLARKGRVMLEVSLMEGDDVPRLKKIHKLPKTAKKALKK